MMPARGLFAVLRVTLSLLCIVVNSDDALSEAVQPQPWWQPQASQNLSWYWQLQGELNTSHDVDVYDIDIDTPQEIIDRLKKRGIKLICYFSVGTVEQFRSDAEQFPAEVVGDPYRDYPDERWLDLSSYASFADIMRARLDRCAAKGFDGVEGDNVDGYVQHTLDENGDVVVGTNFQITRQQSVDYVRWLADESHKRGMAFGLKNAEALAWEVVDQVDWIMTESCFVDNWCIDARPFIEKNKPVFMTEYIERLPDFDAACKLARESGFSAIYRDTELIAGVFEQCLLPIDTR